MEEDLRGWALGTCWRYYPDSEKLGFKLEDDEGRMRRASRFLLNAVEPPDINSSYKEVTKTLQLLHGKSETAEYQPWQFFHKRYTQALMYAPNDTGLLVEAYDKRSAILLKAKKYEDALVDVKRALIIICYDGLKAKLHLRRAECLYELNNQKMNLPIHNAVVEARRWISRIDDTEENKKYIIETLDKLFSLPVSPHVDVLCNHIRPLILPRNNPKIKDASDALEFQYSEEFGRHVVAKRDIKAGELLFGHKSYASVIHEDFMYMYCWNCSKKTYTGVPCLQCPYVIFCNEFCRHSAWRDHHALECRIMDVMLLENMNIIEFLSLRMALKAYKEAGSIDVLRKNLERIDAMDDTIARTMPDNVFDYTKYESVYSLSRKYPSLMTQAIRSAMMMFFLGVTTNFFDKRFRNYFDVRDNSTAITLGALIARYISVCFNSSIAEILRPPIHVIRLQMSPLLAMFNHSCDPSILVHPSGDEKFAIALHDIKAGDQIFTSYLPDHWKLRTERRVKFFKDVLNFTCKCRACRENRDRCIYSSSPSSMPESYAPDVVEKWRHMLAAHPAESGTYSSNISFYIKYFY